MSLIRIENDIASELVSLAQDEKNYIITDKNVIKLLDFKTKIKGRIFALEPGEESKSLRTVEAIITDMYKSGCGRDTKISAIGGGVVGDVAGFVSGIYMRGVEWVNFPTTLLSQIDSAIGGKTGVDFCGCKNLVGLFNEPAKVIIALNFLSTLTEESWLGGVGELIKTSFLDAGLYDAVQSEFEKIKRRDASVMRSVIEKGVEIKKKITDKDPKERGPRKALNIGHTLGHAIEASDKFKRSHGEYVLWGMKYENMLSKEYIESSFYLKMQTLVSRALLGKTPPDVDIQDVVELSMSDKKNSDGLISLIVAGNIGLIREVRYKPKQLYKEFKKCLSVK